jgi:TolB-like protein/Flp pilus assembly protein TadD
VTQPVMRATLVRSCNPKGPTLAAEEQRGSQPGKTPETAPAGVAPGALSALLAELVHAPEAGPGDAWERGLRPGALFGRYELLREIGRGGFGVVWEARDRELGRSVAFKAVRPGSQAGLREERLLREAELAARLSHPNIVTLHDVGRSENGPYLVLELLRGQTLAERLGLGPLPVHEALRIGLELAKAVAHAHGQGVVHRDLKPGNVIIGDDGQVKVLDFGLAHAFGHRKAAGGTPAYMAPEQWRGAPEDERTDVFALGVILYRMLAGELPFPDDGGKAVRGARPAPAVEVPGAPALGELLSRMLEKDPVKRPRDAGEVLAALAVLHREMELTASVPSAPVRTRRRAWRRWAAAGAASGSGLSALLGELRRRLAPRGTTGAAAGVAPGAAPSPGSEGAPAIAVLPFVNLSAHADDAYLADALSEEVINALARIEGLRVAARTSSFAYRGASRDVRRIGRELGVPYVLEGSVQRAGDRLRVGTQLVSVADGYHLWAQRFDRGMADVFAIQDEIAQNVARSLRVILTDRERRALRRLPPADVKAYEYYLRGRQFILQTRKASLRFARDMFERAIEIDPRYALAHAGAAEAAGLLHLYYPPNEEELKVADRASARALELGPELAEAHMARGLTLFLQRKPDEARREFERAVALDGKLSEAYYYQARVSFQEGKFEEAARLFREASRVGHSYQAFFFAAQASEALGRAGEALEAYREALAVVERHMELNPDDPRAATMRAVSLCRLGRRDDGLRWAEQALAIDPQDPGVRYNVACLYALEGATERALACLEEVLRAGFGNKEWFAKDPDLASLRGDPRFQALMAGT